MKKFLGAVLALAATAQVRLVCCIGYAWVVYQIGSVCAALGLRARVRGCIEGVLAGRSCVWPLPDSVIRARSGQTIHPSLYPTQPKQAAVVTLTPANFDEVVNGDNNVLVKFYAPWW